MEALPFKPFLPDITLDEDTMIATSQEILKAMARRRTIRKFSDKSVPKAVIDNCLRAAGTAPSGANKQPWFFGVIESPEAKTKLRRAAEAEEDLFYSKRASKTWLEDLKPFKTNCQKPYLETAPYLIAIFAKMYEGDLKSRTRNYYPKESVGIATGLLINALHGCGLATLTHTPSPMDFLNTELGLCKKQYRPFLLLITGHAANDAEVPVISKKTLEDISTFY